MWLTSRNSAHVLLALLWKGDLVVAISTGGSAPVFARNLEKNLKHSYNRPSN